jgi:Ca2+-binding EF-hand superfamily protein
VPAVPGDQNSDQPFLLLDDAESISRAVQQLQQRYGKPATRSTTPRLSREALGLDAAVFGAHDSDGDGTFDAGELTAFLRNPVPHLVIEAQLPQSKPGKPKIQVLEDRIGAAAKSEAGGSAKLTLSAGGIGMELKTATVRARNDAFDNKAFYRTQFLQADRDKNKYISEEEFPALRLPNAEFKAVDRNGDGMIVVDEILAYVEQESASSQSRIELSISNDGQSVFEVIDENRDRRLSRRELARAFERLRKHDLDGDEAITAVELAGRFQGILEFGRPVLFRAMAGRGGGDMTTPIVNASTAGPDWFRKMDRNRDGDVSMREFLGPLAAFKKLDADGDGLITAAEAEKAGDGSASADR